MAERRMFAKLIVLSDAFLDMPLSARCLYFTLGMLADDDGFVSSPRAILRQCGATQDDMLILLQKRFILSFDSGIIVIKHWRINNYLQSDRKKDTTYKDELRSLMLDENNAYTEKKDEENPCIQNVYTMYTQGSIDKNRLDKVSVEGEKKEDNNQTEKQINNKRYPNISLSDDDYEKLKREMTDYCNGVPSYQFYLEYMSDWGQRNGKTYTYYDIIDWYNKDKSTGKRVFTAATASYNKDSWADRAMRETPVYRRKDE